MRTTAYDKYVCLILLGLFLYSFFFASGTVVYWKEGELDKSTGIFHHAQEIKGVQYSTALYVIPFIFFFLFVNLLFQEETHHITIRYLLSRRHALRRIVVNKMHSGVEEYKRWKRQNT